MLNPKNDNIAYFPTKIRVNSILKKIEKQFPKTPEGLLNFAVLQQAIRDRFDPNHKNKREVASYLLNDAIPHAEICGVDSEWIRSQITKSGLSIRIGG